MTYISTHEFILNFIELLIAKVMRICVSFLLARKNFKVRFLKTGFRHLRAWYSEHLYTLKKYSFLKIENNSS